MSGEETAVSGVCVDCSWVTGTKRDAGGGLQGLIEPSRSEQLMVREGVAPLGEHAAPSNGRELGRVANGKPAATGADARGRLGGPDIDAQTRARRTCCSSEPRAACCGEASGLGSSSRLLPLPGSLKPRGSPVRGAFSSLVSSSVNDLCAVEPRG